MVIFLCLTGLDFSLGFTYQIFVLLSLAILSFSLLPFLMLHYIFVFLPWYQDRILVEVSPLSQTRESKFFKLSFLEKQKRAYSCR